MAFRLIIKDLETGETLKDAECSCIIGGTCEGDDAGVLFGLQGNVLAAGKAVIAMEDALDQARRTVGRSSLDIGIAVARRELDLEKDEENEEE